MYIFLFQDEMAVPDWSKLTTAKISVFYFNILTCYLKFQHSTECNICRQFLCIYIFFSLPLFFFFFLKIRENAFTKR